MKPSKTQPEPKQENIIEELVRRKDEPIPIEPPAGVQRLDPLRKYLLEISQFEPLSKEEEERLALLYREEGDETAVFRLVTANLKLVVKIAMMYNRVFNNALDLIQEGNIGLMEAVKRFDPYRGARLPTYASWWIKAYIIKFILDNFRIVRVGTTNEKRKLLFNLKKEKERLRLQGIDPTPALIAKKLNVSEKAVREMQHNIESTDLSLDSFIGEETSTRYVDTLEATGELVDEQLASGELKDLFETKFREFSHGLSKREQTILRERLIAEEPKTLQQIAEPFGVTREAIRLNEKALIKKIKEFMRRELKGVTELEFSLDN